jgi:hypothetical protein
MGPKTPGAALIQGGFGPRLARATLKTERRSPLVAFSKFDPHRPEVAEPHGPGARRAMLLKYGWWITMVYTALGFGFIAYWALT